MDDDAMDDDAIRRTVTRNKRTRAEHRLGPGSACRAGGLGATAIVEMGQPACGKLRASGSASQDRSNRARRETCGRWYCWYHSGIFSGFASSPTMPRRNSSTTTTNTTPWITVIAADRGIEIGTVRAHTKTVFSKTRTRGQAELTGPLTRLAFVVPRTESK